MLFYLTVILACQLAGESLVIAAGLPLPGPVVGMVLLFAGLLVQGGIPEGLGRVGGALLDNLSLLFVPAGVGVMLHGPLIGQDWLAVTAALLVSTLATIAVTGWLMARLHRDQGPGPGGRLMEEVRDVWVYLARNPLLHLTLTLAAFQAGSWLYRRAGMNPLLNPVMLAVAALVLLLALTGTSYDAYFEGAQFVHFLLGPATVALAIPLYRQLERVRRSWAALGVSILCGSLTAAATAVGTAVLLGASAETVLSLAPKSVTAPVAMGIAEQLGGLPSLTAVLVILTGILGAMLGPPLMNLMGLDDWAARGLAMGTASHGIGTARALQVSELAGAFAGLAMGLNALATAILLPILWRLIG